MRQSAVSDKHKTRLTVIYRWSAAVRFLVKHALLLHQPQHLSDVIQRQILSVLHVGLNLLHACQLLLVRI